MGVPSFCLGHIMLVLYVADIPPHVERLKMLTVKPLTLTLGYSCSVLDIYMPPIPPISHFIVRVLTGLGDT